MVNLRSRDEISDRGRLAYYLNAFTNVFGSICTVVGSPTGVENPGSSDARIFMSLLNNPVRSGQATIQLGVTKTERIKVQVFDVTGRLVRTVADRSFQPGQYNLVWDGVDNSGGKVARGVFFVRSQYADSKFTGQSKLIVLK